MMSITKTINFGRRAASLLLLLILVNHANAQEQSEEEILNTFVESYKNDPMALTSTFGIKVGEEWWHVTSRRIQEPYAVGKNNQYTFHNFGPNEVTLHPGKPNNPTWYFRVDNRSVLDKINTKIWTASTASAKSTPADKVSFDIEDMDGFSSNQKHTAQAYLVMEHFWKKDPAEITHFSRDSSLPSHGAQLVSLYTMKDKRIAWFTLGKDEAANTERGMDKSQIPNLFIITKGKGIGLIGEEEIVLEPGMSVFVGPYVKHIIYNTEDEPLEGILILFGDNIDYATGQSYLDFLDQEYNFYEDNENALK